MHMSWMLRFLSAPILEELADRSLSLVQAFEKESETNTGSVLGLGAFLGNAWARWPLELKGWFSDALEQIETQKGRELLYTALWLSSADEAHELLQSINEVKDNEEAAALKRLQALSRPTPAEIPVIEPYHLDLHWGAYFGSGNDFHLEKILEQLLHMTIDSDASSRERSNGHAAAWSLQKNRQASVHVDLGVMRVFGRRPVIAAIYPSAMNEYLKH
jgi:hypothetical protein